MSVLQKKKPKFYYEPGHPSGFTDDLGILSDVNCWVPAHRAGWRSSFDPTDYIDIITWCGQNFITGTWYVDGYCIFIQRQKDVAWFMLRWG
jgi:hypothetical protein